MLLRPLTQADVHDAERIAGEALSPMIPAPFAAQDAAQSAQRRLRIGHLAELDPGGAWCAEEDGRIVGLSLALVREGLWGLSLFAVDAGYQDRGIGRALLDAALAYADGTRGQLILSSPDPRAMRRYVQAGFELRPAMTAAGIVDRGALPAPHPDVRAATGDDLATTEIASRFVRGATHAPDIPNAIARGDRMLVFGERGFALHQNGMVRLLAATDEEAATALLWAVFAACPPGATANVDYMTAGQDWAVRACVEAGLSLSPDGPIFVRGDVGPLHPYLPSGSYL